MEHHFQSDVSGVLEYATVASPNCDFVPILQQTLCGTLDYFKQSSDALDALHIVLFRAWRYKEECMINFSVSRYQRGIEADEYIRLMDLNNLFERTMSHLYELPTEESIDILQQLIPIDPSARYITYYLRITNTIADEKQYSRAIDFITDQKFNGMNENNIIGISTLIREQQQANTSLAHRVKLTGLMTWLQSNGNNTLITAKPTNSNPRKKRFMIKMLDDVRSKDEPALRRQWQRAQDTKQYTNSHEQAFILICQYLRDHMQPPRSLEYKEVLLQQDETEKKKKVYDDDNENISLLNDVLSRMIQEISSDKDDPIASWKLWCLNILLEKGSGSKSVLTSMVQFSDLWIEKWVVPYAINTFSSLIIKENLLVQYYHHFYNTIYCTPMEKREEGKITNLCLFFFYLLMNIKEKSRYLTFRDYIYQHMSIQYSIEYNLFDIGNPPIDVDAELTKTFNQCNSETVVWDLSLQNLAALTVIYPKAVVMEMVSQCCLNKDRHLTTIPVLRALGDLCRTQVEHNGKQITLLIYCLKSLLKGWGSNMIQENMINIATFIKACSQGMDKYIDFPPLLLPQQYVKQHSGVLIDLAYFIPKEVIPWLNMDDYPENTIFRQLGLVVLDTLCSSESIQWNDWYSALDNTDRRDRPVGCLDPLLLARSISQVLDKRSHNQLATNDLEALLSFQKKLATVMKFMYNNQQLSTELLVFLKEVGTKHDWRTCMTWSDLQYSISFNRDILKNTPFKINIPMQLERIVHDLGGTCHLYEPNDYKDSEGWPTLFEACKLSSCFIKLLFAAKDYWAYSLMLLWNHPNDDTLVTHNLKQVLYPSISSSTSQEYEQLLVRFLGELYDSFDTAGKAIREYPYPNQDLPEFVKLINNSDARIFWIVLYICKLLKEEGVSTADNLTYSLGIIKAFNKCHTWAKPFHISKEQLNSLRSFRDTIFNDEIMCENIAKLWDPEGQETDDMNNAMTIDVFYPFMNPDHRSKQILSILTFCQLCDVFHHHRKNADIREILRVSILQIIEGLQANEERGWFRELAASQTKSRLENWRKEKGLKRRGVLRHIIEPSDKNIILSHIDLLEADPGLQKVLLQTLQLNEEQQVTTKKVHKKYNHIYCK